MVAVLAEGSTVWVLMRRLNSSCSRSMQLVVLALFHWLGGSLVKVNRRSPASSRLFGDVAMAQTPLADEGLTAVLYFLRRGSVDHAGIVGGDLLVQPLGKHEPPGS